MSDATARIAGTIHVGCTSTCSNTAHPPTVAHAVSASPPKSAPASPGAIAMILRSSVSGSGSGVRGRTASARSR
ncbi:MAG: hypothetical protein R3B49_04220 [Phycisphaerales bacterium]